MSSGLLDIHVLEETTSRVFSLTKAIDKQAGVVEELSSGAQRVVRTQNVNPVQKLGHFRSNVSAVLQIYERVETATKRVYDLEEPIDQGVPAVGWPAYLLIVAEAQEVHRDLAMQRELQRFPQLAEAALMVVGRGQANLQRYVRRLSKGVLIPPDESLLKTADLDSVQPSNFSHDDLATLAKLLDQLTRFPEAAKGADQSLLQLMDTYMSKSTAPVLPKLRANTIPAYQNFVSKLRAVLIDAVQVLFTGDAAKQQQFTEVIDGFAQREMKQGSERASKQMPSQPRANAPPVGTGNAPMGSNAGPRPSRPSADALRGPQILHSPGARNSPAPPSTRSANSESSISTPPMPSSGFSGSTPSPRPGGQFNATPHPYSPKGSGSPYSGTGSVGNVGSASNNSGNGPINSAPPNWAVFEALEQTRNDGQASPDDVAKLKREGLALLMQIFVDIEIQCRKSPITSEFGVSGASIQFMKTLQSIANNSRSIEVVLSEVATRAYLAKPPPLWAARSEPSPAARANPMSLYFADCIDCLYANLNQVAGDQLRDPTKSGIFLLTNLAAVEHFITDSTTETLMSLRAQNPPAPNTGMMESMGDVALQRFVKVMDASFKMYLTDWSKLAPNLLDSTLTGSAANAKLSAKDREVVKEKFRVFNSEFDSLVERQRKTQVVDPTLRARMSQEVRKLIGPLYTRFYMKHKDGDFTKNISKYVKYTPAQIENAVTF